MAAFTAALTLVPGGWVGALLVAAALGWVVGGYVRSLRRLAERDELTGLNNRRPFERSLELEWERAARYGRPLSLLFIELDDFGLINKHYGHLMGDEALRAICKQLRQAIRTTDLLARWGGDEFVLILPETDRVQAQMLAERIGRAAAQRPVCDGDGSVTVTLSTGVASTPGTARSHTDLLRQAIEAQRKAKVQKNAVAVVS